MFDRLPPSFVRSPGTLIKNKQKDKKKDKPALAGITEICLFSSHGSYCLQSSFESFDGGFIPINSRF